MFRTLRLAAALLAGLAVPVLAHTMLAHTALAQSAATAPAKPAPRGAATAPHAAAPAPATAAAPNKVDINSATEQQLDALPGVGSARAKAIVAGRPYGELQELVTKKVLTQGVLDGARDKMALANINTSSAATMQKTLPGVGDVRAKAIVAGRPYATPQDLVTKGVLTQGIFSGMKDLVAY